MKPIIKNYKAGASLFHENDRSRELYIVQSGSIKIYRIVGGKEVELAVLGKGSVIGEIALIDGKPRSASAKAVEESSVILIDADTFHQKIKGVPQWLMTIIKMTGLKIRQANQRLQSISSEHQDANIVITLLYFFSRFDPENTGMDLKKVQRQLIQLLGVTHQRIIRVLEVLDKNEFVEIVDNSLRLLNVQKYSEYCDYLRLLIRNGLPKDLTLPDVMGRLLEEVACSVESVLRDDSTNTELSGSEFWELVSNAGCKENCTEMLPKFKELGLIQYVKKQTVEKKANPLDGYMFKINNPNWKRTYLYSKFKELSFLQ